MSSDITSDTQWRLRALGGFELMRDGEVVDVFGARREEQLLAYLAVQGQKLSSRDRIAGSLWPDAPPDVARKSLSYNLFVLKKRFSPLGIESPVEETRKLLRLHPDIEVDAREFAGTLATAAAVTAPTERVLHLDQAVRMYGDGLLPDMDFDWLAPEQERFRTLYKSGAGMLADLTQRDERMRTLMENLPSSAWQSAIGAAAQEPDVMPEPPPPSTIDLAEVQAFAASAAEGLAAGAAEASEWTERLAARELEVLHAADLMLASGQVEPALEMLTGIWRYWFIKNRQAQGLRAMEMVLTTPYGFEGRLSAAAFMAAGNLAHDVGRRDVSLAYVERSLEMWKQFNEADEIMRGHANRGRSLYGLARFDEARAEYDLALAYAETGAPESIVTLLINAARCSLRQRDAESILSDMRRCTTLLDVQEQEDLAARASIAALESGAYLLLQELDEAYSRSAEALRLSQELQHQAGISTAEALRGRVHYWRGDLDEAIRALEASVEAARRSGDPWTRGSALGYLAVVQEEHGDERAAATMWEAITILQDSGDRDSVEYFRSETRRMRTEKGT